MDNKNISPREKFKSRSDKKTKEVKQAKPERKISNTSGAKISYSKGGLKKNDKAHSDLQKTEKIQDDFKENIKTIEQDKKSFKIVEESEPVILKPLEPIETKKSGLPLLLDDITITEGNKHVRITLTKQKNRMVRLQVFYNGVEIRPSTFTGNNPAQNYWELLKGLERK